MMTEFRRFPRSSTGLLLLGVAAVFVAAAAPAGGPVQQAPAPHAAPPATPPMAAAAPTAAPIVAAPPAAAMPPAAMPSAAMAIPAAVAPPAAEPAKPPLPKEISITIDQTRMLDLENPVSTVSVGNPAIADINIQNDRLFLIGKSFGRTNILALGPSGEKVLEMMVYVTSTGGASVTVYKGNRQLSYNCAPTCDRTLMPGDSGQDFDMISGQMSTKMDSGGKHNNE